jgi:hypothetical protein
MEGLTKSDRRLLQAMEAVDEIRARLCGPMPSPGNSLCV